MCQWFQIYTKTHKTRTHFFVFTFLFSILFVSWKLAIDITSSVISKFVWSELEVLFDLSVCRDINFIECWKRKRSTLSPFDIEQTEIHIVIAWNNLISSINYFFRCIDSTRTNKYFFSSDKWNKTKVRIHIKFFDEFQNMFVSTTRC